MSSYKNRIKQIVSDVDKKIKDQFGASIYFDYRKKGVFDNDSYKGFDMIEENHVRYNFKKGKGFPFNELDIVFINQGEKVEKDKYDEKTLFILLINDLTDLEFIDWKTPNFNGAGEVESFTKSEDDFCIGYINEKPNTAADFVNKMPDLGERINNVIYVKNEECFVALISGYKKVKKQYIKADVFAHYQPEINFSLRSLSDDECISFSRIGFKIFFNDIQFNRSVDIVDCVEYLVNRYSKQPESLCYSIQKSGLHLNINPRPDFPNIKKEIRTGSGVMTFQDVNPSHIKCSKQMSHFDFGDDWRALMTEKRCRTDENSLPLGATRVKIFCVIKGKYKGKSLYIVKMQSLDSVPSWDHMTDQIKPIAESHIFWDTRNASWKIEELLDSVNASEMEECLNKTLVVMKAENPRAALNDLGLGSSKKEIQIDIYIRIAKIVI